MFSEMARRVFLRVGPFSHSIQGAAREFYSLKSAKKIHYNKSLEFEKEGWNRSWFEKIKFRKDP